MKKLLTSILFCITLLVLSYTNGKVYAANYEEGIAGISLSLENITYTEIEYMNIKSTFNITYNWTTVRLNLRTEPSMDSDIIVTMDKRCKVKIIITLGEWTKVEYGEKIGYVASRYLTDEELFTGDLNRWKIELTDDEIDLLAKIVWLESRGEIDEGSAACVIVILNRITSKSFSDTMLKVLSDKGEFSSWKLLHTAKPTEREYEIIEEVLRGECDYILSEGYIYFSTSPRNNNGTIKIGNHYFCKED